MRKVRDKNCKTLIIIIGMGRKESQMTFDTLIINGQIIDGTGKKGYHADVGIQGEQIVAIGALKEAGNAARTIDATGHVVCPGFIDKNPAASL